MGLFKGISVLRYVVRRVSREASAFVTNEVHVLQCLGGISVILVQKELSEAQPHCLTPQKLVAFKMKTAIMYVSGNKYYRVIRKQGNID